MKEIIKKYKFFIYILVLIVLKQLLVNKLPIFAIGNSACDDRLMIDIAVNLLSLDWLGPFNSLTFVKGMFFPLFLAINTFLGISYINGVTLFYSISCVVFIYSIKSLFKNKWPLYLIFIILLFNPIMYSTETLGRVYRNSLTPGQVLLILSSIFAIFINRKKGKILGWSILGGLSLASFWNTREDAIWILPLVVVFIMIMIIEHIIINKKNFSLKKLIIFILPIVILEICNLSISTINYTKYGVFTRVDESGTSFSEAIKAIYSVPVEEDIEYVSVTKEKLERLYKISPSLNSISNEINSIAEIMDANGRNPEDKEVEDGWFWWVLRFAAESNGYYENAEKAEKFFSDIANEITTAQNKGLIGKQSTMPSALMSPWRKGYTKKLFNATLDIIKYTNSYDGVDYTAKDSTGSYQSIKLFEIVTNDTAIYPNVDSKLHGWYLYNLNDYHISSVKTDSKDIIDVIDCKKGIPCNINLDYPDLSNVELNIYDIDDKNIETLSLNNNLTSDSNEQRSYHFFDYSTIDTSYYQKKVANVYINRLNSIGQIYKTSGTLCGILGLISYIAITIITIFKDRKMIDKWLILTSILCAYLVLCIGVAYNHISSCHSISSMYLSGSYPLIIIFWTMNLYMFIEYQIIKHKKVNK